jgi:hypothetical protein
MKIISSIQGDEASALLPTLVTHKVATAIAKAPVISGSAGQFCRDKWTRERKIQ